MPPGVDTAWEELWRAPWPNGELADDHPSVTDNAAAAAKASQALMKFSGNNGEKPKEKDGEYQPTEEDGRLTV